MHTEIKAGSEVKLKTGGPLMKVRSVEDGKALCEWFVVGRHCSMHFKITNLVLAVPGKDTNS